MTFLTLFLICTVLFFAFLPCFIAANRNLAQRHQWALFIAVVFLGWTGIGWIGALIFAIGAKETQS